MNDKLDLILENQIHIMNTIIQMNEISVSTMKKLENQINKTKTELK